MSKSEVWDQVHTAYSTGSGKSEAWEDVHKFYGGVATSIKLRQRGLALNKLRKIESETTARNVKRMEEAEKAVSMDTLDKKLENGVKKALNLLHTTDLSEKEIEKQSGLEKLKEAHPWSSSGDNKDYLKVENYIYDNFTKELRKTKSDKREANIQKQIDVFKKKYGSELPKTKAKAIQVPKDYLEAALRVGGFSAEQAKKSAERYNYQGTYGFIIHKSPKSIIISEAKSDFEKQMDTLEKQLDKDIREALSSRL